MSRPKGPKGCGAYLIVHRESGKPYVGGTSNFRRRWNIHRTTLRHNHAPCKALQVAWNECGEDAFDFVVVEELPATATKHEIKACEQKWMDKYPDRYNTLPSAFGAHGHKQSDEWRENNRRANKGRKFTPEHCANISKGHRGKRMAEKDRQHLSDIQRGKPHTREHGQHIGEGLRRAYAEGRRSRARTPEQNAKTAATMRAVRASRSWSTRSKAS